ncbi:folylpolyglutamate synthase/dihydrofolate synthase family protein [Emcibacter sp. SYSU 3D8]|uniref:bifunctional folylpolyglutamate synthase/dihydrofolate synthase n=1 Tax=Emcibacter sp. SYSU 3D8 TaxID=3133969 RepID=UPI0031FEF432
MSSDTLLARLHTFHPKLIDLSLGRTERLLAALGSPHLKLPPVLHVAGTNGKGSTVAHLRAMLEAGGKRVQTYTSPHLVRFHERIRLSGGLISEARLVDILTRCEAVNAGQPITFFEITTVAGFLAFAEDEADYCIVEVGLGGRYDSTNVLERKLATLITPIGLDHQNFLGDSLAGIAGEKAGIIRPGTPAFSAAQAPEALAVIEAEAAGADAPLKVAGRDWKAAADGDGWTFADAAGELRLPVPALAGAHQIGNAALALAALRSLGIAPSQDRIEAALKTVTWPARLQPIIRGPLLDLLATGTRLWLDGGHNPHAAEALAQALAGRKLDLVVGMLEGKDAAEYLRLMAPVTASVKTVPIDGEACHDPENLAELARRVGLKAQAFPEVQSALSACSADEVLICGSLYLAGQVLNASGMIPE